jgi:hypothetical protein
MDANERESPQQEEADLLRTYARESAERAAQAVKPRSSVLPFLVSVLVTAAILAAAFYLWGR